MKILRVEVESFRGFGRRQVFELADTNVFGGPNGNGKTSFFDAILWCLFGKVPRLSGTRDFVVAGDILHNKFAATPQSVEMTIETPDGLLKIRRTDQKVACVINDKKINHSQLLRLLQLDSESGIQTFQRSYLLQQETINDFVRTINPRSRYDTLLSMLRYPLPDVLRTQLIEASIKVTAQHAIVMKNLGIAEEKISILKADVAKLEVVAKSASYEVIEKRYAATLRAMGEELSGLLLPGLPDESNVAFVSVRDRTIALENRISDVRRKFRNVLSQVDLSLRLEQKITREFDKEVASQEIERISGESRVLEESTKRSEAELSTSAHSIQNLKSQIEAASKSHGERRAALAEMRRFVESDICPVCMRTIERASLLRTIDEQMGVSSGTLNDNLRKLEELETSVRVIRDKIMDARSIQAKNADRVNQLRSVIEADEKANALRKELVADNFVSMWGVFSEDLVKFRRRLELRIEQIDKVEIETKEMLSMLGELSAAELLPSRMDELSSITRDSDALRTSNTQLARMSSVIQQYLDAISQAQIGLLSDFVRIQGPLIRSLYQRMYPHPLFSEIELEVAGAYGSGELYLSVSTSQKSVSANPSTIFSASQLNVLAVVVFIALNLRGARADSALMLDDPIHSMDDLNVLGFCDVIRQLKSRRQILLSTHSRDFYRLLLSKLRPSSADRAVKGFWFSDWSEHGPTVEEETVTHVRNQIPMPELRNLERFSTT